MKRPANLGGAFHLVETVSLGLFHQFGDLCNNIDFFRKSNLPPSRGKRLRTRGRFVNRPWHVFTPGRTFTRW